MCSKSNFKCLKVSLVNFCTESIISIETENITLYKHDEKMTCLTVDLNSKYGWASGFFEA